MMLQVYTATGFGGSTWAEFKAINFIPCLILVKFSSGPLARACKFTLVGLGVQILPKACSFVYLFLSNKNEQFFQLMLYMDY